MKTAIWLFVAFLGAGYAKGQTMARITAVEFERKLNANPSATILDVRTLNEYRSGHLPKATLLDFYKTDFETQLKKLDKTKPIFVYCAVGGRSNATVTLLGRLGFKEIYDLAGGIQSWIQADKPIVK